MQPSSANAENLQLENHHEFLPQQVIGCRHYLDPVWEYAYHHIDNHHQESKICSHRQPMLLYSIWKLYIFKKLYPIEIIFKKYSALRDKQYLLPALIPQLYPSWSRPISLILLSSKQFSTTRLAPQGIPQRHLLPPSTKSRHFSLWHVCISQLVNVVTEISDMMYFSKWIDGNGKSKDDGKVTIAGRL